MSKLQDRIRAALSAAPGRRLLYHDLALAVYPTKDYPRAWHYASHGGPPGCYMTLTQTLRRMPDVEWWWEGVGRIVYLRTGA